MTKEQKAAVAEWRKALAEHAATVVYAAFDNADRVMPAEHADTGLTIEILGPDFVWRRYYVRLTPAGPYDPVVLP